MAVALNVPNKILLLGTPKLINSAGTTALLANVCSSTPTPGMLMELADASGVNKWRAHASAAETCPNFVLLEKSKANVDYTTAYAAGDVPEIHALQVGDVFYGILKSGQTVANCGFVQSNGDGKLKASAATTATANVARLQCLDNPGTVAADTRIRVLRVD